ncbi:hypothetical protein ACOMHN_061883 [Nucella lapillus]
MTGERALNMGCGAEDRPYKYRGKKHITEITKAVSGQQGKRVWVGAVDTSSPWVWTNGQYLFQLVGMVSSRGLSVSAVRLPGNNAFLCSLHCRQVSFVLLQGNKCACLKTRPKALPVSDKLKRCPGTFEEYCGTNAAYTVYKNMLAKTVKWASLVDKARYHGNMAYLYRSPLSDHPQVTLGAEDDPMDRKGYVCNSTVYATGPRHTQHLWVAHAQTAAMTWQEALVACMNEGRQLMMLSRDARSCVQEVEGELQKGQSYWVGLSRRNEALWLDGTPVKTSISNLHKGQAACLTMTLTSKTPTFTFESCSGLRLPILCERDSNSGLHAFTHDAHGNHIDTDKETGHLNDYSETISVLVAVLVILTLLSAVLVLLLYHRDKWIPKKSPRSKKKSSRGKTATAPPANSTAKFQNKESDIFITGGASHAGHQHMRTQHVTGDELHNHGATNYDAAANTGKQTLSPLTGGNDFRPTSASLDYTEVTLPGEESSSQHDQGVRVSSVRKSHTVPAALNLTERKHTSSVRVLDYQMDSSQSSITGSDEAYSVLGYRRSIQNAWSNVRRSAYAHVMINRPMETDDDNQSTLYDIAPHLRPPRVRCIDNDYDHTNPENTGKARRLS